MGLKKKNKINPEFNMSSLTDMIFLLLIFFILNSAVVAPNALNLKLPGTSTSKPQIDSKTAAITVAKDGSFYFNGKRIGEEDLRQRIEARGQSSTASITLTPEVGAPTNSVAKVMSFALTYEVEAVLLTEQD